MFTDMRAPLVHLQTLLHGVLIESRECSAITFTASGDVDPQGALHCSLHSSSEDSKHHRTSKTLTCEVSSEWALFPWFSRLSGVKKDQLTTNVTFVFCIATI